MAADLTICGHCGSASKVEDLHCESCGQRLDTAPAVPIQTPAGSARRLMSWAIDGAIGLIAVVITSELSLLLGALVLLVAVPGYYIWMVASTELGTAGHRLARIHVIDDRTGARPDVSMSGLRLTTAFLLLVPFGIPALISVWDMISRNGRPWHDVMSQTRVVPLP